MEACIKNKIKEIFLASSSEVYQTPIKIPTDEKEILKIPDVYNPRYSYGGGKILTELMGINYGKKYFKKMIIFRPHNVYGQDMGNEHVIPEFINKISINLLLNKFLSPTSDHPRPATVPIDPLHIHAYTCVCMNMHGCIWTLMHFPEFYARGQRAMQI